MTLTTTSSRKDYTGNGAILIFAYDFLILANADLGVYLDGVKKTLTTDYTVSGAGLPSGGNVTFVVAPGSGVAVSIIREVAYTQGVDYVENQKFPAETHEGALDRLTMLCQQLLEKIGRAATFKIQSILTNPVMADGVIGKVLRWKTTTELENIDLVGSGVISVPVSAAQGGTGADLSAGGAVGDLLIADAATTLKRLPVGGKGALLVGKPADAVKAAWKIVGADGKFLKALASQADGLEWGDPLLPAKQSFVGLHLRTHPDNDKAANQIALLALARATMDDGYTYEDVVVPGTDAPLAADITVSGAAGLDTGARVASTGYETYLIGKSTTKAKADLRLLLHRAKDYFLDQSQTVDSATGNGLRAAVANTQFGQGIKVATTGKVEFVDVKIRRIGSPTGNIWFVWESDNAGLPSGTVLATSDKLDVSKVPTASTISVRFPFRTPATLTAATQYHLVAQGDFAINAANYVVWEGSNTDTYANGVTEKFDGTTWTVLSSTQDFTFKVYVTRNDTAVTMPAGYDQKCLLTPWIFNNSANVLVPLAYVNRIAKFLGDYTDYKIASTTSTTPLLTDISSLVPPRLIEARAAGDANGALGIGIGPIPGGFAASGTTWLPFGGAGVLTTTDTDRPAVPFTPFLTEFQGVYIIDSSAVSSGFFYLAGWGW